ncbi:hypothetical protein K491DRAFT_705689 [Lophiostoma macrostomum CBS 122681]|uniref:MOSC domain-containing protein n=1 Tax=Lophiostoma macrostomum CBS 122681 TaxID=1314788 RepID=A0A6A6T1P2_9PLEO|nr:hypothetical protein K491DRAFT_705689 [Lophiostoma macrostomum CBS 122681]
MSEMQSSEQLRILKLYVYPIKSLRGISIPKSITTESGFVHDRQFMIWNVSKSETMHIGLQPALGLFTTRFDSSTNPKSVEVAYGLDCTYDKPDEKVLSENLSVPLFPQTKGLNVMEVVMHKSPTMAYDMGARYNEWFSKRFGFEVKLLYIGTNRRKVLGNLPPLTASTRSGILRLTITQVLQTSLGLTLTTLIFLATIVICGLTRPVIRKNLTGSQKGHSITFADLAPFLVISAQSIRNVQGRLPDDTVLDMIKFRPNIVIDGATQEFDEDYWAELQIRDNITIALTQNCARCNSLNVDFATGKTALDATGKVLKLLSKDRRVDPGTKWSPVFGRYGFLLADSRHLDDVILCEGDDVRVSRRNEQRTILGRTPSTLHQES